MGLHTILKKIKLKVSARGALLEEAEPVYSEHFFRSMITFFRRSRCRSAR